MDMNFDGKVVLITGGGTGIGKATARGFLYGGAKVVLNGRRQKVLEQAAMELDPSRQRVITVVGDISQIQTANQLVMSALKHFSGVDVLINNAGIFKPIPFLEHDEADFNSYIDIILRGTFFASKAAIPEMQRRGGGAIVNVGSMWANLALEVTPSSAYSAAKAGVHALTRNLAIEFAKDNIRVNGVSPAVVETPVYKTFMSPEEVNQVLPTFNNLHPLGRNGQPRDVIEAILFLASDKASWITGSILPIDGGVTAGRHLVTS